MAYNQNYQFSPEEFQAFLAYAQNNAQILSRENESNIVLQNNPVAIQNTASAPEISNEEEVDNEEPTDTTFEIEIFIEQVRKYPCLWNINAKEYKDKRLKTNAWNDLAIMFNRSAEFLSKEFKKLKDNLKKCLDRRNKVLMKSGAAASSLPTCKYFEQKGFLHKKTANRPSESNFDVPSPVIPAPENELTPPIPSPNLPAEVSPANSSRPSLSKKKKKNDEKEVILQELQNIEKELKASEQEDDEDMLFCKSIVPTLRKLSSKKNKMAKIKISQLLFEMEFDEECE